MRRRFDSHTNCSNRATIFFVVEILVRGSNNGIIWLSITDEFPCIALHILAAFFVDPYPNQVVPT
jgi:hypothetical protein